MSTQSHPPAVTRVDRESKCEQAKDKQEVYCFIFYIALIIFSSHSCSFYLTKKLLMTFSKFFVQAQSVIVSAVHSCPNRFSCTVLFILCLLTALFGTVYSVKFFHLNCSVAAYFCVSCIHTTISLLVASWYSDGCQIHMQ